MASLKVLADSSIWIDAFKEGADSNLVVEFSSLLLENKLVTTSLIKLELLAGARSKKEFLLLQEELGVIEDLPLDSRVWDLAAEMGFSLRKKGKTIPNTDLIISSAAIVHDCQLWHNDRHFSLIQKAYPLKVR